MSGSTQNDCHSSRYRPALRISSCRIASALRSVSRRSLVASPPTTRIARPGPGNGWRQTRRSGSPISAPTARTSSLNRARSGSTRSKPRAPGRPAPLVLEQGAQRLDELELEVLGQAADVVVGLDRRRARAAAGLDHVRVQRALHEEPRALPALGEPRRLLLEDPDELGPDRLALRLGIRDAAELGQEALLGVDRHEWDAEPVAEGGDDLLALVLAHQAVIDEHARQLIADGAVDEQRRHGGVDAAAEAADDLAVADLGADPPDLLLHDGRRRPRHVAAADVAQERLEDVLPVRRVDDLGVELNAVHRALARLERRDG